MSGGKKLIGQVSAGLETGTGEVLLAIENGTLLTVSPCFELITAAMPIADPNTGQRGLQRLVQVMPIDNCLSPGTLLVKAEGIHLFKDMTEDDTKLHQDLIVSVMKQLQGARMSKAGLVPAGQEDLGKFGGGAKFG